MDINIPLCHEGTLWQSGINYSISITLFSITETKGKTPIESFMFKSFGVGGMKCASLPFIFALFLCLFLFCQKRKFLFKNYFYKYKK